MQILDFIQKNEGPKTEDQQYLQKSSIEINNQQVFFKSSEKMNEISNGSIDVIITSPPYNRGKTYFSDIAEVYNDNKSEKEYLGFLKRVWTECLRVSSNKGVLFLNIGDSAKDQGISEKVARSVEKAGWIRIQDIIWAKSLFGRGHYTPSGGNKRLNNIWEHIFIFVKNRKEYCLDPKAIGIPYADKSNIGRYGKEDLRDPGNVFHICYEKTTGATIKKGHDAPFPIGLPFKCIKLVPNAKTVLDPFLGTGTTLAAALCLGKIGYGYEKYPRINLIESTISNGVKYSPKPIVLIPHYEESIKTLVKLMKNMNLQIKEAKSKKERERRNILLDTLDKIGIESKLVEILRNQNQNSL